MTARLNLKHISVRETSCDTLWTLTPIKDSEASGFREERRSLVDSSLDPSSDN